MYFESYQKNKINMMALQRLYFKFFFSREKMAGKLTKPSEITVEGIL